MKSLKCTVEVLYTLSTNTAINEGVAILWTPAKAMFSAIAVLLAAVKDVSASYDVLVELFESIERFLSRLDIYTKVSLTEAMTNVVVRIMVEVLSILALATKQVRQGRLKKFVKKVFGENDIEAILKRLDRLTLDEARATGAQILEVVHGLVQHQRIVMDDENTVVASYASEDAPMDDKAADCVQKALEIIQQIAGDMNKPRRDELQRSMKKWLSPPDPWVNHNIARRLHHRETGSWWIQGEIFSDWKYSRPSALLWIHGKPGAGKSVLSSSIIQDIRGVCKTGLASLAFFYCDFRDDQKKGLRGLISSLLVQLCGQSDAYYGVLFNFYSVHLSGEEQASDSELVKCLKQMLEFTKEPTLYIIIDALDECPVTTGLPSPREEVLELVKELVGLQVPNLRIGITSRPEADIEPVLGPLSVVSVSLHRENGQAQDIAKYVKFVVNTKTQTWRESDREHVIEVLTKKSDGMFRWAFCQLERLRHCLRQRIRQAVDELPETLDETYDRMLEEIGKENWEYAHRLFHCVSAASRPLRVEELAEFLALDFDTNSTPRLREDWREEDPTYAVLSTCSSLLVVVEMHGSSTIQFSHFSVKEYLTSDRLAEAKDTISRFHVSIKRAHTIIAQACLGVLLHLNTNITNEGLNSFPLAEYAAQHWMDHGLFEGVLPNIQNGLKDLFDPRNRHLTLWIWIFDPLVPAQGQQRRSKRPSDPMATPLHYAALYGLDDVIKFLTVERLQDINARDLARDETPLGVACRRGHTEVARVLLEHGADMKTRDKFGWNPLERASAKGHEKVIQLLLERGANVNAMDKKKRTALHFASRHGHPEAVRVLLEHGADVNSNRNYRSAPLHLASTRSVARVLLEYGAAINARDNVNRTPLLCALDKRRDRVALVLLERGADVNIRDSRNRSPLHLASERGYLDVVQMLLRCNSDIHARNDEGLTPYQVASKYQRHDVMQFLSQHGSEHLDLDHETP